jgi:hypothetical protein
MFIPMSKNSYFFEMDYDFDDQSVSNLKFEVDHLKINLCLPYVLKLYQMAMEAITRSTDVANITSSSEVSDVTSFVNKRKPQEGVSKANTPVVAQTIDELTSEYDIEKKSDPLRVSGKINLPEVVLFAEPEKSNSKILIMNVRFFNFYWSK